MNDEDGKFYHILAYFGLALGKLKKTGVVVVDYEMFIDGDEYKLEYTKNSVNVVCSISIDKNLPIKDIKYEILKWLKLKTSETFRMDVSWPR